MILLASRQGLKLVLPDAFFLQAREEALDEAVLLRSVRGNALLAEPLVSARCSVDSALKHEAGVAPDDRLGPLWADCPETLDAGRLQGSLGLLRSGSQGEFVADNLPLVTIDDSRKLTPAVSPTRVLGVNYKFHARRCDCRWATREYTQQIQRLSSQNGTRTNST